MEAAWDTHSGAGGPMATHSGMNFKERPGRREGKIEIAQGAGEAQPAQPEKAESACKPGSVEDNHSSATCVTAGL